MSQKELQEKILAYRILEGKMDSFSKQRDFVLGKIAELTITLQSIDDIMASKGDVLLPLGSGAYSFGNVVDKGKFIVEIGANIALEKNPEEGKIILNKRKIEMETVMQDIQRAIDETGHAMEQLAPSIQQLMEKEKKAG